MMNSADFQHEPAKQRALRIPLSYVRGWDKIQRWKLGLSVVATGAAAAYVCWAMCSRTGPAAFSPGPVASVHAAWDHNCSACHFDFAALRDDGFDPLVKAGLVSPPNNSPAHLPLHHRSNQKCQTCHAGTQHHDNELATDVGTCASCHQEHRGRDAQIARPADTACTRCHANSAAHRKGGAVSKYSKSIEDVFQFHGSTDVAARDMQPPHPDFRSLKQDPGNVKFTHHQHLTAGIPVADPQGKGRKLVTLDDLPEQSVERYRQPN